MKYLLLLLPVVVLVSSCSSLTSLIPLEYDKALGDNLENQIAAGNIDGEILDSLKYEKVYTYVRNIRNEIIKSNDIRYKQDFPYSIRIIKDDSTINAMCAPGGRIYLFTGILKYLESESQLAGVMAHEIAHADRRHTIEMMAERFGMALALSYIFGNDASEFLNMGAELLSLNFSRTHEADADEFAVKYLYDTKYDPRGVSGFFEKIRKDPQYENHQPEFLSTHPSSESRVKDIEKIWKDLGSREGETGVEKHQEIVKLLNEGEEPLQ